MTVLAVQDVFYRRYSGYPDSGLPEGMWMGGGAVLGDATGGTSVITLHFNPGSDVVSSRIYSLDQLAVYTDLGVSENVVMEQFNLGGPPSLAVGFRGFYRLDILSLFGLGVSALQTRDAAFLPLFLGAQEDAAQTSQLAVTGINTDGRTLTFEAQGYWWGPRSILVPGGPRRPADGMYPQS